MQETVEQTTIGFPAHRPAGLDLSNLELQARQLELERQNKELLHARKVLEGELHQLRTNLQKTAEQHRLALEAGQLGWWDYDLVTGEVLWDDRFKAIFGVSEGKLEYEKVLAIIHPEDRPRVDQAVREATDPALAKPYHLEYRVVWPDGAIRWVVAKGRAYFDSRGSSPQALRFVGTVEDVTERKRAEEALRAAHDQLEQRVRERTLELEAAAERLRSKAGVRQVAEEALLDSEGRYRTLVEAAPVGIGVTDLAGRVLAANRSLCRIVGITAQEVIARSAGSFYVHQSDRKRLLTQVRKTGKVHDWEVQLRRADGTRFFAALSVVRVQFAGRPVLLTIMEDITRQKQAEEHVQAIRKLLGLFASKKAPASNTWRRWSGFCRSNPVSKGWASGSCAPTGGSPTWRTLV